MSVIVSDKILQQADVSEHDLKIEIASRLYQKGNFTLGQASEFAEITQLQLQKELATRNITLHYDSKELLEDVQTTRRNF